MTPSGTAIGLYFRGMTKEDTNALRARLNEIALELGYTAKAGPTYGEGNLAAMLVAIATGELQVIRVEGEGDE